MKKKRNAQCALVNSRALISLLLCTAAAGSMLGGTLLAFFRPETPTKLSQRTLTFAERVAFQRAIEEVYWCHRIWPQERRDPKPSLDAVMSQAQLENKVATYLRNSQTLADYWRRPITGEQLQAEMDRMAKNSKQPEVLRELFEALGNDPFVIAECLAKPVLTERTLATFEVRKERFESRIAKAEMRVPVTTAGARAHYTLRAIAAPSGGCEDDTWTATSTTNPPETRYGHTAVWTGSEMIVWGGQNGGVPSVLNTGGRYNPISDNWVTSSTTNAPEARDLHTAVWTGSEMIVWGGLGSISLNTGGRYNPNTDSWTATSTTNAPDARYLHTAVWTGSEMIVWGGLTGVSSSTGGRYNPSTDGWTATSLTNAPSGRFDSTAVWTGSEMIVWGGAAPSPLNDGGRYNPDADGWTATNTSNAPSARSDHTAVWTGSEMIVWGGTDDTTSFNTGGRYCAQPSPTPTPTPIERPTPTPRPRPTPHPRP
jgi:hypothetical protein